MKYTSAEAAKLLRSLKDELEMVKTLENSSYKFVAAVSENVEDVRPEYDFADCQKKIYELNTKIRKVKHAINVFNTTHTVEGFDMTVDEMLVYLPQLSEQLTKLTFYVRALPKRRAPSNSSSNIIDYVYSNFDVSEAKEEYAKISDTISKAQLALDVLNSTETMEIDI